MKKLIILLVAFLMLVFCNATVSQAITLSFDPAFQGVLVGNQVDVDVVISGLGDGVAPSLGVFGLFIGYDPTILYLAAVTFGDPDLGDQLDILDCGSLYDASDYGLGIKDLFGLSFDRYVGGFNLVDYQADSFTLATLTFDTLAVGNSSLDIIDPNPVISLLGDELGDLLTFERGSGDINVVPEPATLLLLGSGLVGLGYLRKRKTSKVS